MSSRRVFSRTPSRPRPRPPLPLVSWPGRTRSRGPFERGRASCAEYRISIRTEACASIPAGACPWNRASPGSGTCLACPGTLSYPGSLGSPASCCEPRCQDSQTWLYAGTWSAAGLPGTWKTVSRVACFVWVARAARTAASATLAGWGRWMKSGRSWSYWGAGTKK